MSIFNENNGVTLLGLELLAKVQAGQADLHFTRIAIGSGNMPDGKTPRDMTDLVTHEADVEVTRLERFESSATVRGVFNNSSIQAQFWHREQGLYALDPDLGEILYTYGNAGDLAQPIPEEAAVASSRSTSASSSRWGMQR